MKAFLPAFDRRKCKTKPSAKRRSRASSALRAGPSILYPARSSKQTQQSKAEYNYYNFIDRYNTLGLGNNVIILDGANSDSLVAFKQDTKEFVRMTLPYPMASSLVFSTAGSITPRTAGRDAGCGQPMRLEDRNWLREAQRSKHPQPACALQIRPDPLAK